MIGSSSEFFDYVETVVPNWSQDSRTKIGFMLMHYITLMRVSDGRVELEQVLSHSGKPFVQQIMRNEDRVRRFAFALKLEMRIPWKEDQVPEWLEQRAKECRVNVAASLARHKKIGNGCYELYVLTTFVRAAWKVMETVHEETLRALDRVYCGHCHPRYKPKSWMGGKSEEWLRGLKASELPGARTPQAVITQHANAPILVTRPCATRKISQSSQSSQSTESSDPKTASRKQIRGSAPSPAHPNPYSKPVFYPQPSGCYARSHSAHFVILPRLMATPAHAAYYAQCTTPAAYHNAM